jgi:hypothetical protein
MYIKASTEFQRYTTKLPGYWRVKLIFMMQMRVYISYGSRPSVCYIFYIRILNNRKNMQLKYTQNTHYSSAKMLQKCTSMPSFSDTASSSNNSIDSNEEEYRKSAIRWILSYHKKVTKDTQYLAIAYLNRLLQRSLTLTHENYEEVALVVLLIAAKMN